MYKYALIFIGGFVSGIVVTKVVEKIRESKDECSDFQEDDGEGNPFVEDSDEDGTLGEDDSSDYEQNENKNYTNYTSGYSSGDYTRFIDSAKKAHPDEDDVEAEEENEEVKKYKKPKLIKEEEFGEMAGYDCQTLKYYVEDDVLCTEENEKLDEEYYTGDAMTKFGFKDNPDENEIFVRNSRLGIDYNVCKVFGAYADLFGR